jgi:hypothetical protein
MLQAVTDECHSLSQTSILAAAGRLIAAEKKLFVFLSTFNQTGVEWEKK